MSDATTLSSLRDKRSAIAGRIIDLQQELDRLQADLFHVDAVLRLFGLLPEDIPTKGRIPKRSTYFGRNEITRRCYDMLGYSVDSEIEQEVLDRVAGAARWSHLVVR